VTTTSKKVFDRERSAVNQLLQLVSKGGDAAATAPSAIGLLIEADRELALFAIASAIIDGRDDVIIAEAVAAVHEAEEHLEAGDLIDAVNAFKSAWAKAERP
jgi:hypothetical protein